MRVLSHIQQNMIYSSNKEFHHDVISILFSAERLREETAITINHIKKAESTPWQLIRLALRFIHPNSRPKNVDFKYLYDTSTEIHDKWCSILLRTKTALSSVEERHKKTNSYELLIKINEYCEACMTATRLLEHRQLRHYEASSAWAESHYSLKEHKCIDRELALAISSAESVHAKLGLP